MPVYSGLLGLQTRTELAWVTICHDTMIVFRASEALARARRDRPVSPVEKPSTAAVISVSVPRAIKLRATTAITAATRIAPIVIAKLRRSSLHFEHVYPSPDVYPSSHTAQTGTEAASAETNGGGGVSIPLTEKQKCIKPNVRNLQALKWRMRVFLVCSFTNVTS